VALTDEDVDVREGAADALKAIENQREDSPIDEEEAIKIAKKAVSKNDELLDFHVHNIQRDGKIWSVWAMLNQSYYTRDRRHAFTALVYRLIRIDESGRIVEYREIVDPPERRVPKSPNKMLRP